MSLLCCCPAFALLFFWYCVVSLRCYGRCSAIVLLLFLRWSGYGCCCLLQPATVCCCLLLLDAGCCCLMPAVVYRCLLQPAAACCCLVLPVACCCWLLLTAADCCCLLLAAAACWLHGCCLLLSAAACWSKMNHKTIPKSTLCSLQISRKSTANHRKSRDLQTLVFSAFGHADLH